jgi:hypothetical protein
MTPSLNILNFGIYWFATSREQLTLLMAMLESLTKQVYV